MSNEQNETEDPQKDKKLAEIEKSAAEDFLTVIVVFIAFGFLIFGACWIALS